MYNFLSNQKQFFSTGSLIFEEHRDLAYANLQAGYSNSAVSVRNRLPTTHLQSREDGVEMIETGKKKQSSRADDDHWCFHLTAASQWRANA